jgi:hypothetical protein
MSQDSVYDVLILDARDDPDRSTATATSLYVNIEDAFEPLCPRHSRVETSPLYDPVSQIVYAASRDQVTNVWVADRQLIKNRQLLTIDLEQICQKANEWMTKIAGAE